MIVFKNHIKITVFCKTQIKNVLHKNQAKYKLNQDKHDILDLSKKKIIWDRRMDSKILEMIVSSHEQLHILDQCED